MQPNRRRMMSVSALTGALAAIPVLLRAQPKPPRDLQDAPLLHHVFFWLKNPGSTADRAALIAGLKTLRGIPVIKQLHIGVPAATEARDVVDHSYDVSELMLFDTLADQASYQDHPIHRQFVKDCEHLWARVVVYDIAVA